MRTIDPTLSLKPVLDSVLNSALIEIHIDHINMYTCEKSPKNSICRFLQYFE